MKTYEGLFILDAAGKEEVSKELVDKLQKNIEHAGGRVDKVQRMGARPFARDTRKRSFGVLREFRFRCAADGDCGAGREAPSGDGSIPLAVYRSAIEPPVRKPRKIPTTGVVE